MPKFIDLTGQKFGKLTVIEKAENKGGRTAWRCACECGGEAIVTANCLRTEKTKTCGCSKRFVKIGETYGRLTVLEKLNERTADDRMLYLCKCSCGNEVKKPITGILGIKEPSCGCVQREVKIEMVGKRFGRWTVIERVDKDVDGTYWLCRCDCGTERVVNGRGLRTGKSVSCGCYAREVTSRRMKNLTPEEKMKFARYTHRQSDSRLYCIWWGMRERCYRPSKAEYKYYGGRGITICDEWLEDFMNFYNWAMANGYEDHLSIDRIDVNGNYCPENCRWATHKEQCNNRRQNRFLKFNGETHTVKEWADIIGINVVTLRGRLRTGWSVELALTTPTLRKGETIKH